MKMKIPVNHRKKDSVDMLIDEEDYDKIKHLNLRQNNTSNKYTTYIISTIYENTKYIKTLQIHRIIMGLGDFKNDKRIINHINGIGYDNRKCNLEICDTCYNSQSINKPHKKIGHIYFENDTKRKKKWRFSIVHNKKKHSQRFFTEEEAEKYKLEYIKKIYTQEEINKGFIN